MRSRVRQLLPSLSYHNLVKEKVIPSGIFSYRQPKLSSFPRWACSCPPRFGIFVEILLRVFSQMPEKPTSLDDLHRLRDMCILSVYGEVPKEIDKSDTLMWSFWHFSREVREFSHGGGVKPCLIYDSELVSGNVEGHPDILTSNCILDVKTTRCFSNEMLETTILQLLSYYALSDRRRPYIGAVLPMTRDILVYYIGGWNPDRFLGILQETSGDFRELMTETTSTVGSHIPKHPKGVLQSLMDIYEKGGRDFEVPSQIFLSSPQGGNKVYLDEKETEETREYIQARGIRLYVHAPYYINLCHPQTVKGDSIEVLTNEAKIAGEIGARGIVVHIGARKDLSVEEATKRMKANLIRALPYASESCPILLETCCGEGSEILHTPEDLIAFYMSFSKEEREVLRLCLDTCHCFAAGHNPATFLARLIIECGGPQSVRLIHFNDSQETCGSRKDRHARMGMGYLGEMEMRKVLHIANLSKIDLVTE